MNCSELTKSSDHGSQSPFREKNNEEPKKLQIKQEPKKIGFNLDAKPWTPSFALKTNI